MKSQANYKLLKHEFGLYEDDSGVMRCKRRIANADLPHETKFPALLPRDHYIVTLTARKAHERVHHSKVAATLAQLRTRFWIIRGRQFVKKLLPVPFVADMKGVATEYPLKLIYQNLD